LALSKYIVLSLFIIFTSVSFSGVKLNTTSEVLVAKGARNGCVRALMEFTHQELVTDAITDRCEKLYWQMLKEMRDARGDE
jgi:hypothetical protein